MKRKQVKKRRLLIDKERKSKPTTSSQIQTYELVLVVTSQQQSIDRKETWLSHKKMNKYL